MNLDTFAERNRPPTRCWVCRLPSRTLKQVGDGRAKGTGVPTMVDWLLAEGHTGATVAKLNNHFYRCCRAAS